MANKTKKIKNNKKLQSKKENEVIIYNDELKKLFKIILIICGVLLVFYIITSLVQKNDNKSNNDSNTTAIIQYNKILAGEILNRKENEYYVLVEKENDHYIDLYKQYLTSSEKTIYYTVDLSDVFNQGSVAEETVVDGNEVGNYKFADTTLIKVSNGTLNGVYKTKNEIIEVLKNI